MSLHVRARALDNTGPPVLLVHGLSSNARLWDGVAEHLERLGHPVAALDQRGHGRSDKPDGGYDFATLCTDLVAVERDLGWTPGSERRPLVAGQSWGGNVVLELAIRHPGSARALALVDGGTIEMADRFAGWPAARAALSPPALDRLGARSFEAMLRRAHPDWPPAGIEGTLGNVEILADGTIAPWLSRQHHLAILAGLWEHRPSRRYPLVDVPVLVLMAGAPPEWGSGVPAGPAGAEGVGAEGVGAEGVGAQMRFKVSEARRAAEGLSSSVVWWMRGDHDLHAHHPAEVADLLHRAADLSLFDGAR
ncbi:MAG: alpha/beta fold hydrolase [Acidimicrobiales bacterium]